PNPAARLALTADGGLMVYASMTATGTIRVTATGAPVRTFAWPATLGAVALSPDGATFARGERSRILWEETQTGRPVGRLQGHEYDVEALSFSPDGTRLLSASRDRTAALWRRPGEALPQVADGAGRDLLALDPSARRLLVLDPAGIAFAGEGRELLGPPPVAGLAASFDGTGDRAVLWEPGQTRIRAFRFAPSLHETTLVAAAALRRVSFSPGGSFVAAVCVEGSVHIWDAGTGRSVAAFQAEGFPEDDPPSAIAVSADGGRIALGHGGRAEFSIWTADGRQVRRLQGHTGFALAAAFTPDGRRIVTTAADASARVWDLESSEPPAYFRWPRIEETTPVVSADGTRLLVVGAGEARLVSLSGQGEQVSYRVAGGVAHAAFGSDGESVLLADAEGRIRRYPVEFLAMAEAEAPREILPAELARYEVGTAAERATRAAEYDARHPSASAANRRGMAALFAGRLDEAVEQFRGAAKILPWHPDAWVSLATALCRRAATRDGTDPARAEDLSDALTALETAVARGLDGAALAGDPDLATLRDDPRFRALCAPPAIPPR
ncbi:MAG: hypothetical protein HUU15_17685, partial [Candidatus Brocadiae bacterium]|nr:hypothetical protein [Candidatus Brocadiia bacterium]